MTRTIAIAAALFILAVGSAYAGIENTVHNLSVSGPVPFALNSADETEICIFCHTPHGGSLTAPLWNRNAPTGGPYNHYTSSTLSAEVAASRGQNIYDESLMCLSCHDGSVSMYTVMNFSNATGGQPSPPMGNPSGVMIAPASNALIGASTAAPGATDDLTDDHPISFKYEPVRTDAQKDPNRLHLISDAETAGIAFFPLNGLDADKRVECASCHDPHVDYIAGDTTLAPFLRTANTNSAMCLACHNV